MELGFYMMIYKLSQVDEEERGRNRGPQAVLSMSWNVLTLERLRGVLLLQVGKVVACKSVWAQREFCLTNIVFKINLKEILTFNIWEITDKNLHFLAARTESEDVDNPGSKGNNLIIRWLFRVHQDPHLWNLLSITAEEMLITYYRDYAVILTVNIFLTKVKYKIDLESLFLLFFFKKDEKEQIYIHMWG